MSFLKGLKDKYTQFTNSAFLDASVAAAWMIGIADGDFDDDERAQAFKTIDNSDVLSAFTSEQISKSFQSMAGHYDNLWGVGNREALDRISKVTDPAQKDAIMMMAFSVASGNGRLKKCEKLQLIRLVGKLGLEGDVKRGEYADFGLRDMVEPSQEELDAEAAEE